MKRTETLRKLLATWLPTSGYRAGFAVCGALFLAGLLLQMLFGRCTLSFLSFPVNVLVGVAYLFAFIALGGRVSASKPLRWMSSYEVALPSMLSVVWLTMVMGLIRQTDSPHSPAGDWPGFSQMLSAYPFVLLFFWMLTVLGFALIRRMLSFRMRDIPFVLAHLGLFLALMGAVLGNADVQRLTMNLHEGKTERIAFNEQQELRELPFDVELEAFTIDEYPPQLLFVDHETGEALSPDASAHLFVDEGFRSGQLQAWEITVKRNLPLAIPSMVADSVSFIPSDSVGAACALYLEVVNRHTGAKRAGWVSSGSFLFADEALALDDKVSLVMPQRAPRCFTSRIKTYTVSGQRDSAIIQVNQPFATEGWMLYQSGYDSSKGRWSSVSVLELVRDPWLPVVFVGIWMLIAGAVCFAFLLPLTSVRSKFKWIGAFIVLLLLLWVCIRLFGAEMEGRMLTPALQSPWFAPHVVVYMFAYTLLGAATLRALYLLLFKRGAVGEKEMKHCDHLVYVGLSFMTLGMLFGALWAKEAWGHYWNWDPKETWAAATWMGYLCYLHLRFGCRRKVRIALVGLLVCFLLLQMCWYGINYLPAAQGASIHTYDLS